MSVRMPVDFSRNESWFNNVSYHLVWSGIRRSPQAMNERAAYIMSNWDALFTLSPDYMSIAQLYRHRVLYYLLWLEVNEGMVVLEL